MTTVEHRGDRFGDGQFDSVPARAGDKRWRGLDTFGQRLARRAQVRRAVVSLAKLLPEGEIARRRAGGGQHQIAQTRQVP